MTWNAKFDVPIGSMVTLADARAYILALPDDVKAKDAWQTAAKTLLEAAEGRGPMMHAQIAMGQALNGPKPIPEPRLSKVKRWRRR